MSKTERMYSLVNWITIIGLSPIIYLFFGTLIFMFTGILLDYLTDKFFSSLFEDYHIIFNLIAFVGYFIFLNFLVQNQRKKSYKITNELTKKFIIGVIMISIGHIGLALFYTVIIYGVVQGPGSFSGFMLLPMIVWMLLFYSIGYSFVERKRIIKKVGEKNEFVEEI